MVEPNDFDFHTFQKDGANVKRVNFRASYISLTRETFYFT